MPTIYPLLALALWLFAVTVWLRLLAPSWHQLDPRPWVRRRLGIDIPKPIVSWSVQVHPRPTVKPSAEVHPTAELGNHAYIGERVLIDMRARVKTGGFVSKGAWVQPDAVVGKWATVGVRAVVAAGGVVADGAVVPCPEFLDALAAGVWA